MKTSRTIRIRFTCTAAILILLSPHAYADEFGADGHQRQTVYHSPQKPGFTSWVGAWIMPDGSVMTSGKRLRPAVFEEDGLAGTERGVAKDSRQEVGVVVGSRAPGDSAAQQSVGGV